MARLWDLPAEIQLVTGSHHQVLLQGFPHPMAATVCVANELAHELGYRLVPESGSGEETGLESHAAVDTSREKTLAAAREALELREPQMALVRQDAAALLERLGDEQSTSIDRP